MQNFKHWLNHVWAKEFKYVLLTRVWKRKLSKQYLGKTCSLYQGRHFDKHEAVLKLNILKVFVNRLHYLQVFFLLNWNVTVENILWKISKEGKLLTAKGFQWVNIKYLPQTEPCGKKNHSPISFETNIIFITSCSIRL